MSDCTSIALQHTNGLSLLFDNANQGPHVGLLYGAGFSGPQHHDANRRTPYAGAHNERGSRGYGSKKSTGSNK